MRSVELSNRIVLSPMGQDSADHGMATDWHMIHLGSAAVSGPGLIFTEATAVLPEGMSSPGTLGLWNDAQERALKRVIDACRRYSPARHGIQLWHAGRKASLRVPAEGGKELPVADGGWGVVGPSDHPYPGRQNPLHALTEPDLEKITRAFVESALRAARIGYDVLELHCAHGYLLHSFLSPVSNRRTDRYGGDLEGRMRFPSALIKAVRQAWPDHLPMGVRISATDWIDGGWALEDSVVFAAELKRIGVDYVTASSGGSSPEQRIRPAPGYQVRFAETIRCDAGIATMAVGQIWEPHFAEFVVSSGSADLIAIGRGLVAEPRWVWRAAESLQGEVAYPVQYTRCIPQFMRKNLYYKPPPV